MSKKDNIWCVVILCVTFVICFGIAFAVSMAEFINKKKINEINEIVVINCTVVDYYEYNYTCFYYECIEHDEENNCINEIKLNKTCYESATTISFVPPLTTETINATFINYNYSEIGFTFSCDFSLKDGYLIKYRPYYYDLKPAFISTLFFASLIGFTLLISLISIGIIIVK